MIRFVVCKTHSVVIIVFSHHIQQVFPALSPQMSATPSIPGTVSPYIDLRKRCGQMLDLQRVEEMVLDARPEPSQPYLIALRRLFYEFM